MLKEEFTRLMSLFHEAAEGKTQNLEEVFSQSLEFLSHLQEEIATGSAEDKAEAMKMMNQMYEQMMVESKHITERSGLTEEQLVAFAENPANFTPEQWKEIQASKEKIADVGQNIVKTIDNAKKDLGEKEKTQHPKGKKSDRSKWMRS
jgi:3-hydroxyisobutyrate dehydrogenase-like beta-hydroxyacid dehydrogenase